MAEGSRRAPAGGTGLTPCAFIASSMSRLQLARVAQRVAHAQLELHLLAEVAVGHAVGRHARIRLHLQRARRGLSAGGQLDACTSRAAPAVRPARRPARWAPTDRGSAGPTSAAACRLRAGCPAELAAPRRKTAASPVRRRRPPGWSTLNDAQHLAARVGDLHLRVRRRRVLEVDDRSGRWRRDTPARLRRAGAELLRSRIGLPRCEDQHRGHRAWRLPAAD